MIIEEGLVAYIPTVTAVHALIVARFYPLRLPENPTYPAVTYQRISTPRIHAHTGPSHLAYPRFQLDCYATTYLGAKAVATAIRVALDGYKGLMGAVDVQECTVIDERDFYDPATRIWRISLDSIIGHQE